MSTFPTLSVCWNTAVFPSMPPMSATLPLTPSEMGDPPDSDASAWYDADPEGAWDQPSQDPSAPPAISLALVVLIGWSTTPAEAEPGPRRSAAAASPARAAPLRR